MYLGGGQVKIEFPNKKKGYNLQRGQFEDLASQALTHSSLNSWSQGILVSSSSCSNPFKHMGHSFSKSSLRTLEGSLFMKSIDVGGGGLSANRAAKSS